MDLKENDLVFAKVTRSIPKGFLVVGKGFKGLAPIFPRPSDLDYCEDEDGDTEIESFEDLIDQDDILLLRAEDVQNHDRCGFCLYSVADEDYDDWRSVAQRQFGRLRFDARVRAVDEDVVTVSFGIPSFEVILEKTDARLEELEDIRIELTGYDRKRFRLTARMLGE